MSTRYALVGLSKRGLDMFALPLLGRPASGDPADDLSAYGQLVSVTDVDKGRMAAFAERHAVNVPCYVSDAFDRMVDETKPHVVIVASPDHSHAQYAIAALERGLDVITEKPMTADCAQARAMLAAERASSGSIRVAHNVRHTARNRQLKRMVRDGLVGRVTNVDLLWSVDTCHGASYFHRWNRQRALSGGLSVHKSCHHLDLVNWLVDDVPRQVFAYGALNYYGPDSPHNPGKDLSPSEQRQRCPYQRRWATASAAADLPYDVQYPPDEQRYIYDEAIDIEDTYAAVIRFQRGASMTYTLSFSGPWEGYRLGISGTHGRIEASDVTFRDGGGETPESARITHYPMFGQPVSYVVPAAAGGHGGADPRLRHDLFAGPSEESVELGIVADGRAGAYAVATGEAIWRSVRDNRAYELAELLGEFD
ncbi:Gfo/Idh/MocA family protein [Tenggerimyces flavus]|uniref:Gfo/Idh/MocA family protein n=1 Tax=Tenggerimyces flavus TaxID=1708749 RepID=A0ABV7YMA3_9ACTN|nr:Gfo/Idh/MocA family oxidoreductase [Tenggerimyces flavus]MBM7789663.1 putative dehydrogenase [Tenggerimyces flavus]